MQCIYIYIYTRFRALLEKGRVDITHGWKMVSSLLAVHAEFYFIVTFTASFLHDCAGICAEL